MLRTAIYVDGFNLYYGCLRGTDYRWLDIKAACQKVLQPQNDIVFINYFTAMVTEDGGSSSPASQKAYIKALEAHTPELETIYGHYLSHRARMPSADPGGDKFHWVIKTEEKGSDVNLAVNLLNDAWRDLYDCAVVVSNDSDLVEAIRLVKDEHPEKVVGAILPLRKGRRASQKLKKSVDFVRSFRPKALSDSQMPDPIPGTKLAKPPHW